MVKSILKMLTSISLVRPKLVQWRYSQRILIAKIINKIKISRFGGFPILGPILGPIFSLFLPSPSLSSLCGLALSSLCGLALVGP